MWATNFAANSTPFGADMTGLFPKWLTIRRGQALCAILGVVVQPWQLMANAQAFLSFLGSYNIFMAPLCGVILVDYFLIRKGNIHVPSCYDGKPESLYWFWFGVNWTGCVAWILGVTMGIPGLVGQYQPDIISDAGKYMYMMGWLLTFTTASVVYYGVRSFIRPKIFPAGYESAPFTQEWLANDGREGFFEEERAELLSSETPSTTGGERLEMGEKTVKTDV